jgi:hypothetical protein
MGDCDGRLRLLMLSMTRAASRRLRILRCAACGSVLQDCLCPAACQGVVQLSSPVAIYGRGQSGRLFDVQLPPIGEAAVQSLYGCGSAGS